MKCMDRKTDERSLVIFSCMTIHDTIKMVDGNNVLRKKVQFIDIQRNKNSVFGEFDLKDFGMYNMIIRNDLVKDLTASTNYSQVILKKFNIVFNGNIYYIKSGSSNGRLFRVKEPIIEYVASQIGVILGFEVVKYKLWIVDRYLFSEIEASEEGDTESERIIDQVTNRKASLERCLTDSGKVLVCISKSFIPSDDYSFVSCDQLSTGIKQQNLYETLIDLGGGVKEQLDQMILFDYLINNTDRHRKNFGFFKSESSEFRMAPLYDHGISLVTTFRKYVKQESLKNIRLDVPIEELYKIIDKFTPILGVERTKLMKSVLKVRWEYARTLLLEI